MRSETGFAALAVARRLSARRGALAATAAVILAASYFAVRVAVAWQVSLPHAAQDDLRALPDAAVVAANSSGVGAPPCGPAASALPPRAQAAAAAGGFDVEAMTTSDSLSVAALPGAAPDSFVKAYCAPTVHEHAVLTAGQWPGPVAPGAPIPIAVPASTLAALKLHVGSQFTVIGATSHVHADLIVSGAFRRSQNPAGYWAWDTIGPSGVEPVGSYTLYDPVVVDPSAFGGTAGTGTGVTALRSDSSTLLVLPRPQADSAADLAGMSAQASTISDALAKNTNPFYSLSGALPADLDELGASVVTAHAQLLAACLLLGAVTAAGLIAATGLLVGVGAAQSALNRARGAGRWHLVAAHWAELLVLCAAAAVAVPLGTATAHATTPAAWAGAAAIAALAVAVLCMRALREELPADVAAARGRQAPLAYGLRLGADLVLVALAALALWQASGAPLAGRGPSGLIGTDLVVAAAPALVVAAAAGLAGRLVPVVARLAERGAARARRLATVFAFWQVGRTPLGYVLPALVSVAAVAGGTFAVAQNASWQRSTRDQGAYTAGGQVAVTTPWTQSSGQAEAVTHKPGVVASTPVARLSGASASSLLALDSATAPDTVMLRPDLAEGQATALWRRLGSGAPGAIAIPGKPAQLAITAKLSVGGLGPGGTAPDRFDPAKVVATVQDASGLIYPVALGRLPADGGVHALSAPISTGGAPDYPLRLLRFDVSYTAPAVNDAAAEFTVLSLAGSPAGRLSSWVSGATWSGGSPCSVGSSGFFTSGPQPPQQSTKVDSTAGGAATLAFTTGFGQNYNFGGGPCTPIAASVSMSAAPGKATLPALATRAYLNSTGTSVGATVPISVNGANLAARIIGSVNAFPTLAATGPGGLIVDLPALAAEAVEQGATMWPPTEWWLRTTNAAAPAGLPAGSSAVTAAGLGDALARDPLSTIAPHILTLGAADLVLLAALALATCLAAAGRRQAVHEPVLAALGAGRGQRTGIRLLLNLAIVTPAALSGWGLGLLVARQLVPVFVLTPGGTAPLPPVLFTTRPGWSAAAVLGLLAVGIAAALDPGAGGRASRRAGAT